MDKEVGHLLSSFAGSDGTEGQKWLVSFHSRCFEDSFIVLWLLFKKIALEECFCMNLHISASFISLYLQAMVWKRLLKSVMSANIRLLTNSGCCFKGHSAKEGKNRLNNSHLTLIKGKLMYTGYTHQREASLLHPWARLSWGISKWINRLMLNFPLTCLHWHK